MKKALLLCSLIVITSDLFSTNYYISSLGNDSNPGTSTSLPWQTITHLNLQSFSPGDSILFKRGDTFRGNIIINQSGNAAQRIVISAYGSGNNPIISGAKNITTWTFNGTYYQANSVDSIGNFFVDDVEQTLARYPNNHQYLTYDSTAVGYLKDASLPSISASLINGSKVCVHTAQWCWEKSDVSLYASNKITYSSNMVASLAGGYGYFLYNNINHLDTSGEWYYSYSGQQISYMPSSTLDPNLLNCEGSVYTNGIQFGNFASYVTISGISFEKQLNAGINIANSNNKYILIDNCTFKHQYKHGVYSKGRFTEISNSYFREIDGIAVYTTGTGFKPIIHDNIFRNNGQYRNGGLGGQINLSSISCAGTDSVYIHHNNIDSTGYCCISVDGAGGIIERNIVSHAMLINNDGGALKSFGVISHNTIFRNNFVSYGDGCTEGVPNATFITPALYFDNYVNNNSMIENTIFNRTQKGIFINSGANNNTIKGNVIYGGNYGIDLNGSAMTTTQITGMEIKHNVIFLRDNNGYCLRQVDFANAFNAGIIDSNYYFQPYTANHYALRYINNVATSYTFSGWQATGNDLNSQSSFVNWLYPTDSSQLFMNQTDNVLTVSLGTNIFLDLNSNPVCGSITLQPYTSQVLIKTNAICTTGMNSASINSDILIYPNPTEDAFTISIPDFTNDIDYFMCDAMGRTVLKGILTSGKTTLEIGELAPGIYFFITSGENPTTQKIVVR